MLVWTPSQEPLPGLGIYGPRLYKDRSEGGEKKKKVKKDKSNLEMGGNILSFLLGWPGLEKRLSGEIRFWPGSKWKRNKGGKYPMALIAGGAQVTEYRNSGGISLPSTKPYHHLLRNSNPYLYLLILWTPVKTRPLLDKQLLVSLSVPTASQPLFHACSITYFPTEPGLKLRSLNPVPPSGIWICSGYPPKNQQKQISGYSLRTHL